MDQEVQEFVDRAKVRDCIERLARGEDRRSAEIITACFWPDAKVDLGIFLGSFDEYLAYVVPGADSIPVTLHTLGQSLIELDGDTARVESHVTSYHRVDMGEEERDLVLGGRYLDRLEKREGEWRIAARTMLYDWSSDYGRSVDWSQGMMGMPFLTDHSIGAANGDYSETFFGKT